MALIEYRGLHKTFDMPVLAGVDLDVEQGEMLAMVGPSGTGKSVLLKTTIGLITPERGDVHVAGQSVFHSGRKGLQAIRRKVGYVFQHAALFDSMTVFENVSLGISDEEQQLIGRREVAIRVARVLEDVNLEPRQVLGKLPAELSGGMRKRVGLARSIVGRPRIVLYDEPVTGLDPVNSAAVHRLIVEASERLGATSVLVTHDIEGALAICDRVALLDGGLLRFLGTPAEFNSSREPLVQAFVDRTVAAQVAARNLEASRG